MHSTPSDSAPFWRATTLRLGVRRFKHPHRAASQARDLGVGTYHTIKASEQHGSPLRPLTRQRQGSVRCIMAEPREDESASVNDLSPEEVSRIIHSHRKVRYGKSPRQPFPCFFSFSSRVNSCHCCSCGNECVVCARADGVFDRNRVLAVSSAQGQV